MNEKELSSAINRNTEAVNSLAKLFQRDPAKEFQFKGDSKNVSQLQSGVRMEVLGYPDAFNPQVWPILNAPFGEVDNSYDFKFSINPRKIIVSYGVPLQMGNVGGYINFVDTRFFIAFSDDGAKWTNFFIPKKELATGDFEINTDVYKGYMSIREEFETSFRYVRVQGATVLTSPSGIRPIEKLGISWAALSVMAIE